MNNRLHSFMACPLCSGTLVINRSNIINCRKCHKKYTFNNGIPMFLDKDLHTDQIAKQIIYFSDEVSSYASAFRIEPWQEKFISSLLNTSKNWSNKIVLDDACGSGYVTIAAAKKGATVIACDINLSALLRIQQIAKRQGLKNNVICVCCSAEQLPFKNNVIDAVSANAILEHLPNDTQAVQEISRVCKKGAIAIITVPLAYKYLNPLFLLPNYIHDLRIGHLRRYTKESLDALFNGWQKYKLFYSGHSMKAIRLLINRVWPVFDLQEIEDEDLFHSLNKWFASNLTILFKKI